MGIRILLFSAAVLGLVLALGAVFTLWRTQRTESQYPPVGQLHELAEGVLHYYQTGTPAVGTPTLILLHGASTNLNDFYALTAEFPDHLHWVSVDRPGAGYSTRRSGGWMNPAAQAASVMALQKSLNISQAIWVGHSLAGSLVMTGLQEYPQHVIGGVMLAGAAYSWDGGVDLIDHLPAVPVVGPLLTHSLIAPAGSAKFDAGIATAFAPDPVPPHYRQRSAIDLYLRPAQFTTTASDIANLSGYFEARSDSYADISQPVLLIHGDADTIVAAWNHADRLIDVLPNATYHRLPNTGHQPHHVYPRRVAQWISDFVDTIKTP
ncbi:MAG: alpha/beta fold hydrolase [Lysobacterales bacterium]